MVGANLAGSGRRYGDFDGRHVEELAEPVRLFALPAAHGAAQHVQLLLFLTSYGRTRSLHPKRKHVHFLNEWLKHYCTGRIRIRKLKQRRKSSIQMSQMDKK